MCQKDIFGCCVASDWFSASRCECCVFRMPELDKSAKQFLSSCFWTYPVWTPTKPVCTIHCDENKHPCSVYSCLYCCLLKKIALWKIDTILKTAVLLNNVVSNIITCSQLPTKNRWMCSFMNFRYTMLEWIWYQVPSHWTSSSQQGS